VLVWILLDVNSVGLIYGDAPPIHFKLHWSLGAVDAIEFKWVKQNLSIVIFDIKPNKISPFVF
jgi:hypothetical protein